MATAPLTGTPFKPAAAAWTSLGYLWLAFFLNQADRQVLPGVLSLVRAEFGLDLAQLGLLNSWFSWSYAVSVLIAGWLADTYSRKTVLVWALLAWSLTTGLSGLAGGFGTLLLLRALTGAGEACYFPAAASFIADGFGERRAGFAISLHQSANYLGVALAGAIAGWIGEHYGWRSAFAGFGLIGVAVTILLALRLKEPMRAAPAAPGRAPRPALARRVASIFRTPTFAWLVLAFLGMLLVNTAYLAWMPTLLHERFGLSLASAGFNAAVYHQAGAVVGVLIGGKLSDVWARKSVLARPITQMIGLVVGIPFILLLASSGQPWVVYAALGAFGVFRGMYDSNLFTPLFVVIPAETRGLATGLMLSLAFFGGGFAPWLVGILAKTQGLGAALGWSACGYAFGALCLVLACVTSFRRDAQRAQAL